MTMMMMCSFCSNCVREVLSELCGHSGGCSLWCCWILLHYTNSCFYDFIQPTSLYNAVQTNSSMNCIPQKWSYSRIVFCRPMILGYICYMYLINRQLSVDVISMNLQKKSWLKSTSQTSLWLSKRRWCWQRSKSDSFTSSMLRRTTSLHCSGTWPGDLHNALK